MKKYSTALVIMMCLAVTIAFSAKPRKVIGAGEGTSHFREAYHQLAGTSVTLSRDTVWILSGWYFVDSTATINIQSGTLIYGDTLSAATLIIKRGGQIFATGTAQAPIVFTSPKQAGRRAPGDWGGVIILGQAPTNQSTNKQVEGGFGTVPDSYTGYGGTITNDNSGVFQYVRIEFAGIAFSQDNESNGLTLGGVGSGTTIDHVQVSFGNDDDFEFFGGTVRAKYLVGWRSVDDCFDTDFGFSGALQYLYSKRDPNLFDASSSGSSNGPESDNNGTSPYIGWPRTSARFSNWTLVGPASDTNASINSKWDHTAMLRRNSALSIYNSIMIGWHKGIQLRDSLTHVNALNDTLQLRHISVASKYPGIIKSSQASGLNAISWFETAGWGNIGSAGRQQTAIGLPAEVFNLNNTNNPVPPTSSEPATAGTAFDGRLAGDAFFDNVTYRGAFVPGQPMSAQWTAGWTNFEPENYNPEVTTDVKVVDNKLPSTFQLNQNYPNPFNPSTKISYLVKELSHVLSAVYNILGQELVTLVNRELAAGRYTVDWSGMDSKGSSFSAGIYFYRMTAGSFVETKKMIMVK